MCHFVDEQTRDQRRQTVCPRSHSLQKEAIGVQACVTAERELLVALLKLGQCCICGVGLSSPTSVSGGRARLLGTRPLRFQEEQRKQRRPGGRRGPEGWVSKCFLSPGASKLPNGLCRGAPHGQMTRERWGGTFSGGGGRLTTQRAEPGVLSTEVGGLVQTKICTQERPSSW